MTSSIRSVMSGADLQPGGVARWGELINTDEPGIYVVSTARDIDKAGQSRRPAPLDLDALDHLLLLRPNLMLDGAHPSRQQLAARLIESWLADEHILYIGLAADLHNRVNQYYGTPLGARRPHAGGWFLKTLQGLDKLYIHWSVTYDRAIAEDLAIGSFVKSVSSESLAELGDRERPFPFANLEWPPGTRKRHGISGAKTLRVRAPGTESGRRSSAERDRGIPPTPSISSSVGQRHGPQAPTQPVTTADIAGGRVRISRRSKQLFPSDKCTVDIRLRGSALRASWDPRLGPPERSGVIGIPRDLLGRVVLPDEVLITSLDDLVYALD